MTHAIKTLPFLLVCFALSGCDDALSDSPTTPPLLSDCEKVWLEKANHISLNTDIFEFHKKENNTTVYYQYNDEETVTVPYTDVDRLNQITLLVKAGIFEQVSDLINRGDINLSGFFRDEVNIDTRVPPMGLHTRKANGGQYRLTEKGKRWFGIDKDTYEFFVCIGQEKQASKETRVTADGTVITETHYTLVNLPEWYAGELITAIPKIEQEIDVRQNSKTVSTSKVIRRPNEQHDH